MSARSRVLRISPEAAKDFDDILLYSQELWGEEQADRYETSLTNAFERIESHIHIGQQRNELRRNVRSYHVEHHVIFYRLEDELVEVVRILHERVNPSLRL